MSAPDWKMMGDPLNDRLPPRLRSKPPLPQLMLPCEGSNLVGHAVMGDGQPLVLCQMCGQIYIPAGTYGSVPEHDRPDILAMIERGDFDER